MQMNINLSGDANEFSQAILEHYTLSVYAFSERTMASKIPEGEFLGLHFNFKSDFDGHLPTGAIGTNHFNMIYLPPGTRCHAAPGDFMAVTIHFERAYLEQLSALFPILTEFLVLAENRMPAQVGNRHLIISPDITDALTELFMMINYFPGTVHEKFMNTIIPRITLKAMKNLMTAPDTPYNHIKILEAREHLLENLGDRLALPIVQAITGLTQQHLEEGFRDLFNTTVTDFIKKERIKKARVLLRDTYMPVRSVGATVGYPELTGFIQFFKTMTGVTPGAFRNREVGG